MLKNVKFERVHLKEYIDTTYVRIIKGLHFEMSIL